MSVQDPGSINFARVKQAIEEKIPEDNSERNTIFDALNNANVDGDKENLSKAELKTFISSLNGLLSSASNQLAEAISATFEVLTDIIKGTFKPEKADKVKQDNQVEQEQVPSDHVPPKFPSNEYLDKDSQYQAYKQQLLDIDSRMAILENKYHMKRDDLSTQFGIIGKKESNEYTNLSFEYKTLMHEFENYSKVMDNWQDEDLGEDSFCQHNYVKFSHIEKITLKNGQHAYRALKAGESEPKVYYPYWDGTVGGPEVPADLL